MRPPHWMVLTHEGFDGASMRVGIRIRRWHPGWWLFVVKEVLHAIRTYERQNP